MADPAQNGAPVRVPTRGTVETQEMEALHPVATAELSAIHLKVSEEPELVTIPGGIFEPE
jgi:hypothetical protein